MLSAQARQHAKNQAAFPRKTRVQVKVRKSISDPSASLGSGPDSDDLSTLFDKPPKSTRQPPTYYLEPKDGIQAHGRTYQRLWSRGRDTSILDSSHRNVQRTKYYCASRDPSPELIEILEPRELLYTAGGSRLRRHSSARLLPDASESSIVELFRSDFKLRPTKSFTEASPAHSNPSLKRIPNRLLLDGPYGTQHRDLRGERGRTPVPLDLDSNCNLQRFYEQVESERHHNPVTAYKLTKQPSFVYSVHPAHARRAGSLCSSVDRERTIVVQDSDSDIQIRRCPPLPALFRETPSETNQVAVSGRRSSRVGLPPLPPNAAAKLKQSQTEVRVGPPEYVTSNSRLLTATISFGDTVGEEHPDLYKYKPNISYSTPSCTHQVKRTGSRQVPRSRVRDAESCTDLHSKLLSVSDPCVKCPICIESCGRSRVHYQSMQSRYMTDLEWRICHAVNIYVYQNGVENRAPLLVHIPPGKKKSMKHVMTLIHDRLKFPIGFAKTLYKMDGTRIRHPCELEMYNNYVAANNYDKHFKCVQYGRKRSPLLVLNRESKHIRQLRLQNDQYDQFLMKKQAAGDERPQYVYPVMYTSDGYGPADLPAGSGGNYQPCGPVCKLPKKKCARDRYGEDGMGDVGSSGVQSCAQQDNSNMSYGYGTNPSNAPSQAQNRVKFENNPIVGNVAVSPVKLKGSVEMLAKKKPAPTSTQEEDAKNDNVTNNNVEPNESTTTTNTSKPDNYKSIGDEDDAVFFQKKRTSLGVIDSTGNMKKVFRSSETKVSRPSPAADYNEIPEAFEQSAEEVTDTEVDDESEYAPSISAPSPSYTVVKPRNRADVQQTRRTQTLEESDLNVSGLSGASMHVPQQQQRKPSKQVNAAQQQHQIRSQAQYAQQQTQHAQQQHQHVQQQPQHAQQQPQLAQQQPQHVPPQAQHSQQQPQHAQQQAQYVQQQPQHLQQPFQQVQLQQVQQYAPMTEQQNVAYQQNQAAQRFVLLQQPLRMTQPQMQALRLPPPQQQPGRIAQHQQQNLRIPQQAMKFAQQLQQSRLPQPVQPPERFSPQQIPQRFYQTQGSQQTQGFTQQQEQQQSQGFLQQLDQQQAQRFVQREEQQLEGPPYFDQTSVQEEQSDLQWTPPSQATQLGQYTMPSYQSPQPQQQQVYNLLEQRPNRPMPPHMMLNTGSQFSTGFLPGLRLGHDQRTLTPSQNEEVDIPYTPIDGASRKPPTLLPRYIFGSSSGLNQQFCFNPRPPIKASSKRNVAIQMGIPDPEIINAVSSSKFSMMSSSSTNNNLPENKHQNSMTPMEMLQLSIQNQHLRLQQAVLEQEQVAQIMNSNNSIANSTKSCEPSFVYQPVLVQESAPINSNFSGRPSNHNPLSLSHQHQPNDQNYCTLVPNECLPPPSRFADSTNTTLSFHNSSHSNEHSQNQDGRHGHGLQLQQRSSRNLAQGQQHSHSPRNCPNPNQPPQCRYEDYIYVNGRKSQVNLPKRTGR